MKNQKKNIIVLLIVIAIILYFCLKGDFINVVQEIKKVNPIWLLIALVYATLYLFVRAINLNMILRQFKEKYPLRKSIKMAISTSFFDSITPFSSGGQPFQIYLLKQEGFQVSESTNSVIQYSIVYQIALVLFGLIAVILNSAFNILEDNSLLKYLIMIGFGINLLVVVILIFFSFSKKTNIKILTFIINILGKLRIIKNKNELIEKISNNMDNFVSNSKQLFKNYKLLIKGVLLTMIGFVFLYSIPLYIALGLNDYTSLNLIATLVSSTYVMMIGSFVPVPGGSGGIEYGFLKFFGNFITGTKLKALMLLWRFATYYFVIIVGGITLLSYKRKNGAK